MAGTGKADSEEEDLVNLDTKGAIVFVITASTFLVLMFYFMSSWFMWVLIILFCIGGIQVRQLIFVGFTPNFLIEKYHVLWGAYGLVPYYCPSLNYS